jgi:photosystem II stability/assembly factor-like uncharacterized protein
MPYPKHYFLSSVRFFLLLSCWSSLTFQQNVRAWQPPAEFWTLSSTGSRASLRGLQICDDDQTIWACGNNSTVLRSEDLGQIWSQVSPQGYEKIDFRSIAAWDKKNAMIASAGTPAIVLATHDGGSHWHEVLRRSEEKAFFDGLKFFNRQQGIVFSDPVDEKWLILTTADSGKTWTEVPKSALPLLKEGEAAFAASNSALYVSADGKAWIGTGGIQSVHSKIYRSNNFGRTWQESSSPLPSGEASGIFSIAQDNTGRLVAVGGDYRPDKESPHTAVFSDDQGATWQLASVEPKSFRSSVIALPHTSETQTSWLTTGPTGTDISEDGSTWKPCSETGFHVLATNSSGIVVAVGSDGRFGMARLNQN